MQKVWLTFFFLLFIRYVDSICFFFSLEHLNKCRKWIEMSRHWKKNKIEREFLWNDELRAELVAAEWDQSVVRYHMLDLHNFQPSLRLMPHVTWARGSLELHNLLSKKLAPSQGITSTLQIPNLQTINFPVLLILCFSHFSCIHMKLSSWITLYKVTGKRSNVYFFLLQERKLIFTA